VTRALSRRLGTSLVLSALVVSGLTASAGAAGTGLGDATPAEDGRCDDADGYTYLQTGSAQGRYRVPSDGIITGWQFGAPQVRAPEAVGFRLGRVDGSSYTVVGASPDAVVTPGTTISQSVRIPARTGDLLGLYVRGSVESSDCVRSTAQDSDTLVYTPLNVTAGPMPDVVEFPHVQLAVAATLEPDADADGYGDLTQDLCPTEASTQATCPAPETTAGKATVKKLVKGKRQVKVAFSASKPGGTFQCALDSATRYRPCTSPYQARLKVGKHVLRIRAVGGNGQVEATPAVVRIKVKR